MRKAIVLGLVLAGVATGASAQLRQPRCGGWPSGEGNPGMIVGQPGSPCYGQLFPSIPPRMVLKEVRVIRAPDHGSFNIIGLREFEFTASSGQTGFDRLGLEMVWSRNGTDETRRTRYWTTTQAEFEKAGGSAGRAPPGMLVTRRPGIGGLPGQ